MAFFFAIESGHLIHVKNENTVYHNLGNCFLISSFPSIPNTETLEVAPLPAAPEAPLAWSVFVCDPMQQLCDLEQGAQTVSAACFVCPFAKRWKQLCLTE